ncbi:hypothetical protein [Chitinophaga flava]|uniref:Uncharacterized protein n=1 Tax=Chitinophaga flava TaxID=2259036 RepID=A0A365Y6E6_9BACT|nr:hypothetical protein [Chitinophaga flava]RBL93475.1 hypothetical protein DF182_13245 [Chitinophaga flava]
MSIKYSLIFASLLTGFAQQVRAQYPSEDTIKTINTNKIELTKKPQLSADKLPYKISGIEVVCVVWDTAHMGYLRVGMEFAFQSYVPDRNMSSYLADYIDKAYSHLYTPDGVKLLWVVEDLRVAARGAGIMEKSYVRLKATVYGSPDGMQYKRLNTVDDIKMSSGMLANFKHKTDIAEALNRLLLKSPETGESFLTKASIVTRHIRKREIPALMAAKLNDGVYMSFEEFRENNPSIRTFEMEKHRRQLDVFKIMPDGKKESLISCWAIVKDGEAYRVVEDMFLPIEKQGYGYIFSDFIENRKRRKSFRRRGAPVDGIAGSLILSTAPFIVDTDNFRFLDPRPPATAIDMETGAFIF